MYSLGLKGGVKVEDRTLRIFIAHLTLKGTSNIVEMSSMVRVES